MNPTNQSIDREQREQWTQLCDRSQLTALEREYLLYRVGLCFPWRSLTRRFGRRAVKLEWSLPLLMERLCVCAFAENPRSVS